MTSSIVIAGAGQAAVQLAGSLRQGGFDGAITVVGDEPGLPYQRPPLSKEFMAGVTGTAAPLLRPESFYAAERIALRGGQRVTAIDRAASRVTVSSGESLDYGHLVLATGARNRPLMCEGVQLAGVHGLRTLADATVLRDHLGSARAVVVIGAGFIGLEFAAVAAARGLPVTVVELAPRCLARAVSVPMAAHIADAHRGWNVRMCFETGVARLFGADHVEAVETTSGERMPADLVLVGIGVIPNVELAAEAGLLTSNGIVVNEHLLTSDPAISAIGDCAIFPSPFAPAPVRLEAVQNAADQARAVASGLLGRPAAYAKVPWFWSDQGTLKLQIAGLSTGHDRCVLRGDPAQGGFSVFCFQGERLLAVESLNRPGDHMMARRMLSGRPVISDAQAGDVGFDLRTIGTAPNR